MSVAKRRKVGVTAEFPRSGAVIIGTPEAAIHVRVNDVDKDGTVYFEVQAVRGHFPGYGARGVTQVLNGSVEPGEHPARADRG